MFSAASITIPTEGFTPVQGHSDAWIDRMGDLLSRHFFDLPPDLPGSLADLPKIRGYYREILGDLGAMVEVERERVGPHLALRTIIKLPQQPRGMTYVASLTFPFRTCSFVVKVQCPEQAMIGLRDTFMSAELGIRTEGSDWICADGRPWFADPYDPRVRQRRPAQPLGRRGVGRCVRGPPADSSARACASHASPGHVAARGPRAAGLWLVQQIRSSFRVPPGR